MEDLGSGDITTSALGIAEKKAEAIIVANENCILCGVYVAKAIFELLGSIKIEILSYDGETIKKGQSILRLKGKAGLILAGERTALNFLMHLSGIATLTAKVVKIAQNRGIAIYDTRKTIPGLRKLEKYAVRVGGANNHRLNLSRGLMIKENHIRVFQEKYNSKTPISDMVKVLRKSYPYKEIIVEVKNMKELKDALNSGANVLLLDNWRISQIHKALLLKKNKDIIFEISGGVHFANIADYLLPGIDRISLGIITHSAPAIDFALYIV